MEITKYILVAIYNEGKISMWTTILINIALVFYVINCIRGWRAK